MNEKLIDRPSKEKSSAEIIAYAIQQMRKGFNYLPSHDSIGEKGRDHYKYAIKLLEQLESRAASAVLCDQGLRKWGDPPTKEEIKAVWDFEQGGGFPKGNLCDYGAIENVVCKWQELRAAALTRQAQDGPVIGDEQLRSAAKEMVNYARSRNVLLPREREIIDGLEAALAPRREPESTQEHDYTSTACYHGLHDRCRKQCKFCSVSCRCKCHAESTQEPPSQQEVFGDNESSRFVAGMKGASARAAGFPKDAQHGYAGRNADRWVDGWEYCNDCLRDPNFKPAAPASVQPSTEDMVERMYISTRESEGSYREEMTAALAVARAGWHSWESVEKAIMNQFSEESAGHIRPSRSAKEFADCVRTWLSRLEAEPAERVTVRDASVLLDGREVAAFVGPERIARAGAYAERLKSEIRKADAQGGNKV